MHEMNHVSQELHEYLDNCCSTNAVASITGEGFITNLMEHFGYDFDNYLRRKYHIRIISYETLCYVVHREFMKMQNADNLYLLNIANGHHRSVEARDLSVIRAIVRKYYQDFNDINLRIKLLFDSKYGTKFLSKQTKVPANIITKARHDHIPINDIDDLDRLQLENFYLNSELAKHIRRLKVNF